MTEKGKKTLIGAFVLGAIAILLTFIFLVAGQFFNTSYQFVCYFTSSLRGLVQGSPVNLNGVPIGKVLSIQVISNTEDISYSVPIIIEIDKTSLFVADKYSFFSQEDADKVMAEYINRGLRAQLGMQSLLTGQLSVDLNFTATTNENNLAVLSMPRYDGLMQIPSMPTQLDEVWRTFSEIPFEKIAEEILATFQEMQKTLQGVSVLIDESNLDELSKTYITFGETITKTVNNFDKTQESLDTLILSVDKTSNSMKSLIDSNTKTINTLLTSADTMVQQATLLVDQVSNTISEDSPLLLELSQALTSIQNAGKSVNQLATMLQSNPQALIFGKK